jgi:flagellar P-ring protein precursor FlgI
VLVQTVLKGANHKSYAVAQGGLVIGGYAVQGRSGSKVKTGITTVGRVPAGALVEREIPTKFIFDGKLFLSLRRPSFSLASNMAKIIEENIGEGAAFPQDGGTVVVTIPKEFVKRPVDLVAQLHDLEVKVSRRARVVISERTQTIVAGGDVRLSSVAIVHGNLTIVIKETPVVSQPGALAAGQTVQTQESQVEVHEERSAMQYIDGAATLSDLAAALGTLGLSARELISVLQAMKEAGALEAELVVQ